MIPVFVATRNAHKVEEFAALLRELPFDVRPLPRDVPDAPENGSSFEANAMEKATFYGSYCDGWVLADDSGLCVDELGGRPGVLSARYAGVHGDDRRNNKKLLDELVGISEERRSAQFVCALAMWNEAEGIGFVVRGMLRGEILREPRGHNGFGYDPLFWIRSREQSLAEMPPTEKNSISHRHAAVQKLIDTWRARFP